MTFPTLFCFMSLKILFTTILVAFQEEAKINGCNRSVIFFFAESFIEDFLNCYLKGYILFN